MTLGDAVARRIEELLIKNQWSLYKLSKDSCVPLSTLKNLYTKHTKCPTLALIYKLAEAFKITPLEFLSPEYFNIDNVEYD